MTLREFGAYAAEYMAAATQLATYRLAREWMNAGVGPSTAAAWANEGYQPTEAAPLIAAGVTAEMVAEMDQIAIDVVGSPEGRAMQVIDRLVTEGVLVDPKRVRRYRDPDDPTHIVVDIDGEDD